MYGLYQRYYAGLAKAGVQLITQFDSMGGTTWGLAEWQDQDPKTAPKLQVGRGCYLLTCSSYKLQVIRIRSRALACLSLCSSLCELKNETGVDELLQDVAVCFTILTWEWST
jgi:hypothetical protein